MNLDIDLHSLVTAVPLVNGGDPINPPSGTLTLRYEVRRFQNTQSLAYQLQYYVICTSRIHIASTASTSGTPNTTGGVSYSGYPIYLDYQVQLTCNGEPAPAFSVRDYSPKTLNSSISQNTSNTEDKQQSSTTEHTSGSSTSQTNSFDANVGLGFFGESLLGNAGGGYGYSATRGRDASSARSVFAGTSAETSTSESMTVKDWSGYGALGSTRSTVSWSWTQEYPWNFLQFNTPISTADANINLPDFVVDRMRAPLSGAKTTYVALPPSGLALFGIDFQMKSVWVIDPANRATSVFEHIVSWWFGSHTVDVEAGTVTASVTACSVSPLVGESPSPVLLPLPLSIALPDLSLLALDAVSGKDRCLGAVVGFAPNQFLTPPGDSDPFVITSAENNLHVSGTGFAATMEAAVTAKTTATVTISFKITDTHYDYALHLRHWIKGDTAVNLAITINPETTNFSLAKVVDATRGQGADRNELIIDLRDQTFDSDNFHDYLVPGLNTITIAVSSSESTGTATYKLSGVALGLIS